MAAKANAFCPSWQPAPRETLLADVGRGITTSAVGGVEATMRNAWLLALGAAGCSLPNRIHLLFVLLEGVDPMAITYPCGRDEIMSVLPHRDPFLWLTRVVECVPGEHIVAELDVDPTLPLFNGHFPEHPVLPGVIIMEALAQAASFCVLEARGAEGAIGFLTGVDKAKFRHQVQPGDTLRLEADIVKSSSRMVVAEVVATVDGKVAASATQKYVLA